MIGRLRTATALCLWAACLACEVMGAPLPDSLRARAGAEGAVEVFVLLDDGGAAAESYSPPAEGRFPRHRRAALLGRVESAGRVELLRSYRGVAALALAVDATALETLAQQPEVLAVEPMRYGGAALAQSVQQIGAASLHAGWQRGAGAVLAVVDSGIDATHPDIAGRVLAEECICAQCCLGKRSRASGAGSAASESSHGPHVAGILASAGVVSPPGVAPDARLVAVRVLNDENRGSLGDWIAALDYILAERPEVHVINMSLVTDTLYPAPCDNADAFTMAMSELVRQLRLRGTLLVAAAGNARAVGMLPAPACLQEVISVGAVDKSDVIAAFSNADARVSLLAPGVAILSDGTGGRTAVASGTSMAAPHVAGAIALLLPHVGRTLIGALPGVLRANGPRLTDPRLCDGDRCPTTPRLDVESAAAWLSAVPNMRPGGGLPARNCQVEWRIDGMFMEKGLRATRLHCRDGDPACDGDDIDGQCSFRVQACFNVPDLRLAACDPMQSIHAYHLSKPSLLAQDPSEVLNAVRVLGSLPPLPIEEPGQCGRPFELVVPAGMSRSLMMTVETRRGRDSDRLRFACRPAS